MPIEDVVLDRLKQLYPTQGRPNYWNDHMRKAVLEYRKLVLKNAESSEFEELLKRAESKSKLMHRAKENDKAQP